MTLVSKHGKYANIGINLYSNDEPERVARYVDVIDFQLFTESGTLQFFYRRNNSSIGYVCTKQVFRIFADVEEVTAEVTAHAQTYFDD